MIYDLQEELVSFDHFDIWDEQDNVCFQVDREFLTWGKTLRVRDAQGRLCATVHHVPFSIPCSFELETAGGTLELDRHFSLFSRSYSIDSLGWEVEGDFFGVDYAITKGSQTVARMEKAWPAFHDRYASRSPIRRTRWPRSAPFSPSTAAMSTTRIEPIVATKGSP